MIFRVTNHQLFSEQLMRNLDWKTPEIENHKCILVHHNDPFTQLGPFKIEMAYNSPIIMIIHELFTEEDTDYLVDWATPRLSRTRQISLKEDDGQRPKNEWMYRKTVTRFSFIMFCSHLSPYRPEQFIRASRPG